MSEFVINRAVTGNMSKPGCYLKYDFVTEVADGTFDDQPWVTVLKVPKKKIGSLKADLCIEQRDGDELVRRRKYSLSETEFAKLFGKGTRATISEVQFAALVADDKKVIDYGTAALAARITP